MKSRQILTGVVAVLFLAMVAAASWAVPQRVVREKLLRTLGTKRASGGIEMVVSPDGTHTAWVTCGKGGNIVFMDGKAVGTYPRVVDPWMDSRFAAIVPGLVFSNKGGHLAFAVVDGKQMRVVTNGKLGKAYDRAGLVTFSPDGRRYAYAAYKSGKWFAVVDGREGKRYNELSPELGSPLAFSSDGNSVAYVASIGDQRFTVIDEKELPYCLSVRSIVLSKLGAHYAFAYSQKNGKGVVKDGRSIRGARPPFFLSPNGKRIAYHAVGRGGYLVVDGKSVAACPNPVSAAAFSPDSKHFAYVVTPFKNPHGRKRLVVDGKQSKQMYSRISQLTFSPDSKRLACCVTIDAKRRLLVDGRIMDIRGWASSPVFSPDSKHIACMIGTCSIALDGKQISKSPRGCQKPVFSPDSTHILYVGYKPRATVYVDGKPGRSYDAILSSEIFFDAPNRFHHFARRNGNVYRVDETI